MGIAETLYPNQNPQVADVPPAATPAPADSSKAATDNAVAPTPAQSETVTKPVVPDTQSKPAETPKEAPKAEAAPEDKKPEQVPVVEEKKEEKPEDKKEEKKEEKPEEKKDDKKTEEQKPLGAPEKYEDFKTPDGVKIESKQGDAFKTIAKELNLSQDQAQKLIDLQSSFALAHQKAAVDAFAETVNSWKAEATKELGAAYDKKVATAARAMDKFGSPELKQLLTDTGIGNHKAMVKLLSRIGEAVSEDVFTEGKGAANVPTSAAKTFYPNLN